MGGSAGKNKSSNNNEFSSDVWGPQGDALKDLYGQASELYGGSDGFMKQIQNAAGNSSQFGQSLLGNMMGGQNNMLGGGSFGDTSDIREQLLGNMNNGQSQMGKMYNSIIGGEGNSYIDPMVDAMKSGAMENNAMMQSGNAMDATSMGQGGSSRHAMQNAMTNKATNQQMLDQETAMRGGAYDKDLAMKMGIAGQADQNNQMNNDRLMQMLTGADNNVNAGMGYGNSMSGINQGQMNPWMQAQQSQWNPMNNWASILGGPTTLNSGSGSGSSKGSSLQGGLFG